ncbi:MAG TPA: tRNA (adenosine(37)-N6)-dimethylallyltransferase MiaA [Firmicutes bacterium]|nr:tRNA (adenosine(37)-N6)-dimethylallyltransferase MiaA [Bacillota bacterium]
MSQDIIAIVGPTASGKTDLSLSLASELDGEIISADSMQVYIGLDIGTAKVDLENQTIPHHLIDIVEPNEDFSVAEYQELAEEAIIEIQKRGKRPIFVGGTGLYIQAALDGLLFPEPKRDEKLRQKLLAQAEELGNEYMYRRLLSCDEESAQKIHPNDIRRIVRALEVYIKTGVPLSKLQKEAREFTPKHKAIWIGVTDERQILYNRIDARVDKMLNNGLLEEVTALYENGLSSNSTAYQALGYKEMIWYLKGLVTMDEAVRILKRDTRRYAKRQLSWFRRDKRIKWFSHADFADPSSLHEAVFEYITFCDLDA